VRDLAHPGGRAPDRGAAGRDRARVRRALRARAPQLPRGARGDPRVRARRGRWRRRGRAALERGPGRARRAAAGGRAPVVGGEGGAPRGQGVTPPRGGRLVIATRRSRLALWQAEHVKARLQALTRGMEVELLALSTRGDELVDVSLAKVGGKGLFVKE